ncbi:hypothetical protein ACH4E7_19410 [Kitasatospora sp. NPDC018058]|uniref:hypothetical protein n=1 Tax=Kitasatospora sp. NPDC018058 TaxID=3364025 RepID=UPI0037C1744E
MTKDEALASGALETDPVSLLNGCTDFAYKGGPAPDPVRMAAEADARAKSDRATAKMDEIKAKMKAPETLPPGASALTADTDESPAPAQGRAGAGDALGRDGRAGADRQGSAAGARP